MRVSGTRIWIQCAAFFIRNALSLIVIAPLLIMPFVCDALLAILIDQEQREGRLRPLVAVQEALRGLPVYERLKLYYWLRAFAWALIPIYGIILSLDDRIRWAMSSNVAYIERRTDFSSGAERCKELTAEFRGECIRVLITIPVSLLALVAVMLALSTSPWMFWTIVAACIWILIPGSAAANTFLYLWMRDVEEAQREPEPADLREAVQRMIS